MRILNDSFSLRKINPPVALGLFITLGTAFASPAQQPAAAPLDWHDTDRTLSIHADSQDKGKDVSRLRGHVEITYRGMKLTANEVTYNAASGEIVATGHVLFVDPRSHVVADEVHYNLRTEM